MGIYLPNMEMPTSCFECFARTDVNIGVGIADGCNLIKAMISNPDERLPDCPLSPAPPHGRLIDADALMENAQYKGTHDIVTAWDIVDAPTIIPADHIGGVNEMVADKEGEG